MLILVIPSTFCTRHYCIHVLLVHEVTLQLPTHIHKHVYTCILFIQALRETIRNVLHVCRNKSLSSVAFPSLGTGILGYPPHVVADILFTEVLVFNNKHPAFFRDVVFVISEKEIYESFMKVYIKQLSIYNSDKVCKLE